MSWFKLAQRIGIIIANEHAMLEINLEQIFGCLFQCFKPASKPAQSRESNFQVLLSAVLGM